jgi:porin
MKPLVLAGLAMVAFDAPAFADEGEMPPVHPHAQQDHSGITDTDPFRIEAAYTADIWYSVSGGVRSGSRYLDNVDLMAEANLQELLGWQGATAFGYILYNNGNSLSELLGDAQVASNIETGVKAVRLYEAWIDQKLGETASLRVGLYDLNSEFDALETSGLFIGSAHGIGTDISQTGGNGPSIFPVTSLAARLSVDLSDQWKVRAAILDGVPGDPDRPRRTAIKLGDGDGALLIGEVERAGEAGRLIAGYWRYTAQFDRITGGTSRNNDGFYIRGESHLTREEDETQGLAGFFRLGFADGQINRFASFASAGLTYTGLFPGRDQDQIGLGAATAFVSANARQALESDAAETAVELTYLAPITKFLSIQPNVQYVINPDADSTLPNAFAIGVRIMISFSD